MQLESRKLLFDIQRAVEKVINFIQDKSFVEYESDDLVRSAVERQFEIMGEALNQLSKTDTATVKKITEYRKIIAFRNILIHGYADIDNRLVWNIIESKLPDLKAQVAGLLEH